MAFKIRQSFIGPTMGNSAILQQQRGMAKIESIK